jgi:hypothetical protein
VQYAQNTLRKTELIAEKLIDKGPAVWYYIGAEGKEPNALNK